MRAAMSTVTSTLAMVRAAEARGIDASPTLARHSVTRAILADPDREIPVEIEFAIWDELRSRTNLPALQLFAPGELPVGTYHVVEYLAGASATVGEAIQRLARFIGIIARQVSLKTVEDAHGGRLLPTMPAGGAVPALYVDFTFAAVLGRMRHFRPSFTIARVDLRQTRPADAAPYADLFGLDVRFGAAVDQLCIARDEWDAALPTHDPSLAQVLETHARIRLERVGRTPAALGAEVRDALIRSLPNGACIDDVARALHVSVRTLQRRLSDAGSSYREALDAVRSDLARQYLLDQRVAIAEVALLLGFADQSSFHRAFERWTGAAPGRWRQEHRLIG